MKIDKIIISPHFDDACLSTFSVLDKNSLVVTVFSGIPIKSYATNWDTLCGFKNSVEAMITRAEENDLASNYIGFKTINLGYIDWQYNEKNNQKDIRIKIKDIIDLYPRATVFCPLSSGGASSHPDHITVTKIITNIFKKLENKLIFYADLPYQIGRELNWRNVKRQKMKEKACSIYKSQMLSLFKEFPEFNSTTLTKEAYLKKE